MMMTNLCPARLSSHWWQNIASKSRSRLSCFLIIVTYQSLWITNKINAFVLEHVCYNVNLQWAVTKQKKDKPNVEFQHISPSYWRDKDDGEPLIDILSDWGLACQLRVSWLTTHQVQRLDSALPLTHSHLHLQCTHPDAFNLSPNLENWVFLGGQLYPSEPLGILQTNRLERCWWAPSISSCCCSCGQSPCPPVDKHRLNGSGLWLQLQRLLQNTQPLQFSGAHQLDQLRVWKRPTAKI